MEDETRQKKNKTKNNYRIGILPGYLSSPEPRAKVAVVILKGLFSNWHSSPPIYVPGTSALTSRLQLP